MLLQRMKHLLEIDEGVGEGCVTVGEGDREDEQLGRGEREEEREDIIHAWIAVDDAARQEFGSLFVSSWAETGATRKAAYTGTATASDMLCDVGGCAAREGRQVSSNLA